ncbi:MAG TPA: hypothetical protein VNP20_14840 [Nocardioidaceae bacterium]|nr:hypothetical protein [Nocardioidaceae bacterium]
MHATVAAVMIAASVLVAGWALVYVVRGKSLDDSLFYGLAAIELGLLALVLGGSIALAGTDRDVDGATFLGYLLTALLIVPGAVVWSLAEKSRWGMAVLVAGCLVVAVMVLRVQQVWDAGA